MRRNRPRRDSGAPKLLVLSALRDAGGAWLTARDIAQRVDVYEGEIRIILRGAEYRGEVTHRKQRVPNKRGTGMRLQYVFRLTGAQAAPEPARERFYSQGARGSTRLKGSDAWWEQQAARRQW